LCDSGTFPTVFSDFQARDAWMFGHAHPEMDEGDDVEMHPVIQHLAIEGMMD
jgi:hypothetical protein